MRFTKGIATAGFERPPASRPSRPSPRFDKAVESIAETWPDVIPDSSPTDRRVILARVVRRHAAADWTGVKRSDVLVAARVAFDGKTIDDPTIQPLRKFLMEQAEITDSVPFVRALFAVHLESYEPGSSHTRTLAAALSTNRENLGLTERRMVERLPELLYPKSAPAAIARRLVGEEDAGATLREWGFRDLYSNGLMHHLHLAVVLGFTSDLAKGDPAVLARFIRWLKPDERAPRVLGAEVAIGVALSPWLQREVPADYLRALVSGITAVYGDPRLPASAAWTRVSTECRKLMMRWLTGTTMTVFLEAISRSNDEAMWKPRKKFWMELYEAKHIDEAWVAFSQEAHRVAQRMATTPEERALYASFGRQTAGGARVNTSLLVMKIGSRIIIEGSHNYKVQLFKRSNPNCPALYQAKYDCEWLRLRSDDDKIHSKDSWQSWVRQKVL